MAIFTLIAGLVLLALAGDALVRGAVAASRRMHIPPIVIGLTVVALGTSAPELFVSVEAALNGAPGLAIGNVVGSNIANSLIVLGLPAIVAPIFLVEDGIRRSSVFMIAVSLGVVLLAQDGEISRLEGLILFSLLVIYLTYSGIAASRARQMPPAAADVEAATDIFNLRQVLLLIGFGIIGLGLGGKLTTDGALGVAGMFGLADSTVGLVIVALGTSLPELAASIAAAWRRQTGVVIGNVIGSNIFNLLGILGVTAMLVPLDVSPAIASFDLWIMLAASVALVPIAFSTRRVNRWEGSAMTLAYLAYCVAVFLNGVAV